MSTGIIPINSRSIRTIKTKGYSKSSLPLINKEDYAILYGLKSKFIKTFYYSFTTTSRPLMEKGLSPEWVSGFSDAECSFSLKIIKRSGYKLGWGADPSFIIGLHAKELPLLEKIQAFFGVGDISIGNNNTVTYYVASVPALTNVIIPHFDRYPLITKKRADFLLFKSALDIINNKGAKKALTLDYITKLISIKSALNWGLSDVLKETFPDIVPVLRPEIE